MKLKSQKNPVKTQEGSVKFPGDPGSSGSDEKLSPNQLHALINTSPIGIIVVGDKFIIEFVNQSLADLFLYKPEDMVGKDFRKLLSAEDAEVVVDRYLSRRKGKATPEKYQISVIRRDGKKIHLDLTSAISSDENGNTKTISQIVDITDKIEISNTLRETESRYKTLVENSPYAIILSDLKGKLISANPKTVELFGYASTEELVHAEKTLVDFVADFERKRSFFDAQRTIHAGYGGPFYYAFLKKDGTSFMGEISAAIIKDDSGNSQAYMAMIHDVSKRIMAENELKESKQFLQNTFDAIQDGISVLDADMRVILTNRWMEGMYAEEIPLKGKKCYEVFHQSQVECSICPTRATFKSGLLSVEVVPYTRSGNIEGWLELSAFPVKDETGKVINVIEYVKDITDKRQAQMKLLENEEFISAIANTSPAMIHVFDLRLNKQVYINEAVNNLLGYTPKELIDISSGPEDGLMHPDDREHFGKHLQMLRSQKSDSVFETTYRLRHKNGEYRVFKSYERPFQRDTSNDVSKIIAVTIDITDQQVVYEDLQATTSRLSNIMKAANDGMWDWYLETGKVIFDPRYYQMAGYEINEFPYHLDEFSKRVHPDDLSNTFQTAQDHLEGRTERFIVEFRFKRKDNSWMWILGRGLIAERDETGKPLRLMGTHTDISELKRIQNDLELAKNKAEESDRLKSAFLANMSHEIRTPMNGILGFADLLKREALTDSERNEYINIIQRSGYRMLNTINDIIDLSKIEAGQTDLVLNTRNLNETLIYLHEFFQPEAEKKALKLSVSLGLKDKEANISTDHEKLTAICSNLLKNALKYTNTGSVEFGYAVSDQKLIFHVKDSGIGIAKNRQEAIFERFVQEDLSITKAYEGSGLGLSISKGFVELMGGSIWVDSEPGKGSAFYFSIPYVALKPEAAAEQKVTIKTNTMDRLKKLNVLIADDDESTLYYLSEILKTRCNRIIRAKTGTEVVDICKNQTDIGVILMDIKMPELDGYEATKQIRDFNKDVIIIGQTAYALVGDRQKVLDAGCNDYITKPIDKEELLQKIEKYL